MTYEICAILAVLIFGILAIYIISTLLLVQKTLKQHTILTTHIDENLKRMDSTFRTISNLGYISEEKTLQLRENLHHLNAAHSSQVDDSTEEIVGLLLSFLKLGSKYLRRK